MPVFVVDAFLAPLNLTWQPVDVLKTALARLDAGLLAVSGKRRDGHIWLRVQLRNAALRQTPQAFGYAGGNLLNLLIELGFPASDWKGSCR